MRAQWVALAAMGAVLLAIGWAATIPVGVTAQDVRNQTESIRRADPEMLLDSAVESAMQTLQQQQRRRVTYFFSAYLVLWVVLGGYMLILSRRQAHLEREIERLRSELAE